MPKWRNFGKSGHTVDHLVPKFFQKPLLPFYVSFVVPQSVDVSVKRRDAISCDALKAIFCLNLLTNHWRRHCLPFRIEKFYPGFVKMSFFSVYKSIALYLNKKGSRPRKLRTRTMDLMFRRIKGIQAIKHKPSSGYGRRLTIKRSWVRIPVKLLCFKWQRPRMVNFMKKSKCNKIVSYHILTQFLFCWVTKALYTFIFLTLLCLVTYF